MKRRSLLVVLASAICLSVCPGADEKDDPIVGKWNWYTAKRVEVHADGTASVEGSRHGKWKRLTNSTPPTYEFNWRDRYIDTLRMVKGGKELRGEDKTRKKISAFRIEE